MLNPLLKSKAGVRKVLLGWVTVSLLQLLLFYVVFQVPLALAFVDSFLYNFILYILARSIWHLCYFNTIQPSTYIPSILSHILASIILISLWFGPVTYLLVKIGNQDYADFSQSILGYRFMLGFLYYIGISAIFYTLIYSEERKELELKRLTLESDLKEVQFSLLKSQLNPHFIFNTLNSISSLTISRPEKAQEMVIQLSDFLRYSLKKTETWVTLKEELGAIQKYLAIEKTRFGSKLDLQLQVDEDTLSFLIPSLILQPLIENAIKYGVYESTEKCTLNVLAKMDNPTLRLIIKNDFDPESPVKKGTGMGLQIVKSRLKELYQELHLLEIRQINNIFEVELTFPPNDRSSY